MDKDKDIDELNSEGEIQSDDDNPNQFKIRNPVREPATKIYAAQELHSLIHEGSIDLNPPYQRDVVWPESKQIRLIDSIFRNFYIPPIIFAITREGDEEETRVCLDGKQRLTSIQKFFDGQIPHKDYKTKKNFWFTRSESHKGSRLEIPESWKKHFAEKGITCVEYNDLPSGTEREIFQRVQMGMTLTAAEKLQAIDTPWAGWISDLEARHVSCDGGLASILQWDTSRGRDFQCIAHLVYCCYGLPSQQIPTATKMETWLSKPDGPDVEFKERIHSVLKAFWHIAHTKDLNMGFTKIDKKLAPVEFVFVGVLLYEMRHKSDEDKGRAIYDMRRNIRLDFRDIRSNAVVCKALWKFISNFPEPAEGGKKKRKRQKPTTGDGDDIDEDDNYRNKPAPKAIGPPSKGAKIKGPKKN